MFTISPQSNTPITIDPYRIKQPFHKHYPAKDEELDDYINELDDDFEDDESGYPLDYSSQSSHSPNNKTPTSDLNIENDEDEEEDDVIIEDEEDDDEIVTGMGY